MKYDPLDRLTNATKTGLTQGWTYDANGNRLTQTGTVTGTYTISTTSNRLMSITGTPARTYVYDNAGNVLSYGTVTNTFNNRGRMATAVSGGITTSYVYNALGQRILKSSVLGTVLSMYDEAGHLLGEYDGAGGLIEETLWLGDLPVATLRPNGGGVSIYYVHADQLGSPKMVTRATDNAIVWRWDTDPFGTTAANEDPGGLGTFKYNVRFPGQYYDAETAVNYNYHRDYDPSTGRYAESDPVGLRGGLNTYTYVDDDPIGGVDPFGRYKVHGNWCGPDWTGGYKKSWDELAVFYQLRAAPPVDPVDAACMKHDKCYAGCRGKYPCSRSDRSHCFADCDVTLYASTYSQGFWGHMVASALNHEDAKKGG